MNNGITNDESSKIAGFIQSMERIGTFCEKCRMPKCICKIDEIKKCTKCKKVLPKTLEYFHFDKRIGRGYKNHCKDCCNEYKKNKRKIQKAGEYYGDKRIASYFGISLDNTDLLEVKRFHLILKDRIEGKKHCIINSNGFYCVLCNKYENVLLPINLDRLIIAGESFLKNHKHNE